jgi:hypothetical protein
MSKVVSTGGSKRQGSEGAKEQASKKTKVGAGTSADTSALLDLLERAELDRVAAAASTRGREHLNKLLERAKKLLACAKAELKAADLSNEICGACKKEEKGCKHCALCNSAQCKECVLECYGCQKALCQDCNNVCDFNEDCENAICPDCLASTVCKQIHGCEECQDDFECVDCGPCQRGY